MEILFFYLIVRVGNLEVCYILGNVIDDNDL